MGATGLPAWQSSQPGQVGNQAALTVEPVPGSRLVTPISVHAGFRIQPISGSLFSGLILPHPQPILKTARQSRDPHRVRSCCHSSSAQLTTSPPCSRRATMTARPPSEIVLQARLVADPH